MDEIIFLTHFDHMYPPNDIHGWKAMDKSFLMVFLKKNYIDPTGRQNFGDAPGQIPKLILTLCLSDFRLISLLEVRFYFFHVLWNQNFKPVSSRHSNNTRSESKLP